MNIIGTFAGDNALVIFFGYFKRQPKRSSHLRPLRSRHLSSKVKALSSSTNSSRTCAKTTSPTKERIVSLSNSFYSILRKLAISLGNALFKVLFASMTSTTETQRSICEALTIAKESLWRQQIQTTNFGLN